MCHILLIIPKGGDSSVADTLLTNMERINVVAELLYDLLSDNPRAQVLTEIILEASQDQRSNSNNTATRPAHSPKSA